MSKEEFLKIQTCVLKVNIHCDGCKQKVKKILQKIEGVYTIKIDSEQGKVTVSGNVNGATLIKKLTKNGKHAEIWGAPKTNNNNHFKNLQIENGKGGKHQQQQPQLQKGGAANQPKGGGFPHGIHPQMKGFQDLKLPPLNNNPNQKMMKVNLPEDEGLSDDDYDDEFDDDDDYTDEEDDDFEDELDDGPPMNKMKPMMGNGNGGMPNMMIAQQAQQMMKAAAAANGGGNGGNGGGNGKKGGGGGNIPTQMMNLGGGGGKKGGNGNNNSGNQSQGGSGGGGGKGGKNGGGQPQLGGGNGGGGAGHINNFIAHGPKKGGGMNDGPYGMLPNMMSMNAAAPSGPHIPNLPMTQMTNLAAVQGLPAMNAGAGAGGPEHMAGNPFLQQQMAAMMMNQQSPVAAGGGNERFQHMMYARPPPAVNYMPAPYPPYPYPPPPGERADQYSMFSDENTTSCTVM